LAEDWGTPEPELIIGDSEDGQDIATTDDPVDVRHDVCDVRVRTETNVRVAVRM
jgi:hypothetical protein